MTRQIEGTVEMRADADTGAAERFEPFFERHHATLYRRMVMLCGNRAEAEELTQEAFVRLWERWDRVSALEDPEGYLYRTALNQFRTRYRRSKLALRRVLAQPTPSDPYLDAEERTAVSTALATLSPRQRAALVLTQLIGYTSEEAASIMHVRPGTVRSLAAQGRAALQATMEDPR